MEGSSFFEKNAPPGTPSWVRTAEVPTTGSRSGKGDGTLRFPICDDLATLTWLVNLAALELHVHQWQITKAGKANSVERDGENGATWEVEVTRTDGSTVDVRLDAGDGLVVVESDSEDGGSQ